MHKLFFKHQLLILLSLLFLFTRFYNLTLLPIFTDESIYIYWAKYIATFHTNWFMSLTDGKPPLLVWLIAILLKIFPSNMYLFAGRTLSVIAGGLTIIAVYKLTLLLFGSKKTSILAVLLCILNPFLLFYDRMALYDSFLCAMLIWSVYFAIKTSIYFKLKDAIFWGIFLGLAFLTKPPAIILLLLTPLCFFILIKKEDLEKQKTKIISLPIIALIIAEIFNNLQQLSSNYRLFNLKNQQFQLSFHDFFAQPFILFGKNLQEIINWIIAYYTWPIFGIGVLAFIYLFYKYFKKGVVLLILWFMPIFLFAIFGKILFSRYILFTTPYFLIVLALGLSKVFSYKFSNFLKVLIVILMFFLTFRFDYYLLTNPVRAALPDADYSQYITSEYSGYGLDKVFSYLDEKIINGPQIMIVTQGKFGLFPYAFKLKYWDNKQVMFYQAWLDKKLDVDVYALSLASNVYIAMWQNNTIPSNFPFKLILKAEKPDGGHPILLTIPK